MDREYQRSYQDSEEYLGGQALYSRIDVQENEMRKPIGFDRKRESMIEIVKPIGYKNG